MYRQATNFNCKIGNIYVIHQMTKLRIRIYFHKNGVEPFTEWLETLDKLTQARVNARIARFEDRYFGDYKSVGGGVFEARIFLGPGYRIYFSLLGSQIFLLLTGGDKSRQSNDIRKAKEFLKLYLEISNANKK